jgi:hypothetical protein
MNAAYMKETLVFAVMVQVSENEFETKRELVSIFRHISDAEIFATKLREVNISIWNIRSGECIKQF